MRSDHYGDLWVCHALATHAPYSVTKRQQLKTYDLRSHEMIATVTMDTLWKAMAKGNALCTAWTMHPDDMNATSSQTNSDEDP